VENIQLVPIPILELIKTDCKTSALTKISCLSVDKRKLVYVNVPNQNIAKIKNNTMIKGNHQKMELRQKKIVINKKRKKEKKQLRLVFQQVKL